MKQNVIILLFTLLSLNLYAKSPNGDKVDPLIENRFKKEFGASVNVSWEIIQNISIATYTVQGEEKQVYYFSDGEILGFGKTLRKDLLPPTVTNSINKRFDSEIIQAVYEFKSKDAPTGYFIRLFTPHTMKIVSANEFGEIAVIQTKRSRTRNF
jgi:hypothetical protein